jgi:hypothetical protein
VRARGRRRQVGHTAQRERGGAGAGEGGEEMGRLGQKAEGWGFLAYFSFFFYSKFLMSFSFYFLF